MSAEDTIPDEPAADLAAALLDVELTPGQQKMLRTLADLFMTGWTEGDQRVAVGIPRSRWMLQTLRMVGVDIEEEYATLPWVPTRHGPYGLLQPTPENGNLLDPSLKWRLTLAGCLKLSDGGVTQVVSAARRLVVAAAQTYAMPKSPADTEPCTAAHTAIMRNCPQSFEIEHLLSHAEIVLSTFPPLSGIRLNPERSDNQVEATWNIPDAVYLFGGCTTDRDLLNRLLSLNQPLPQTGRAPLNPTALADELDHLDAAWFRRFGKGFFTSGGLDLVTAVTTSLPVATPAELGKALIDLDAIIGRWQPPKEQTAPKGRVTPTRIADSIRQHFPEIDHEALAAPLGVFEAVIHMRNGTAHSRSRSKVLKGADTLGIPETATPAERWDQIRREVIAASAAIRALIRN